MWYIDESDMVVAWVLSLNTCGEAMVIDSRAQVRILQQYSSFHVVNTCRVAMDPGSRGQVCMK